jgi:hypothetical protein
MDNKPTTIELTKVEHGYLLGIQQKHQAALSFELNGAVRDLLDELGLREREEKGLITINISPDFKTLTFIPTTQPLAEESTGTPPPPAPVPAPGPNEGPTA